MSAFTLDQFLVFATVAEEGSFSAAARKLGRAQSAVTYAMQKLEDQADSSLFDRTSYRPTLTEAGRALLPQARRVLDSLADFRRTAKSFTSGTEAEVHLAVDAFVPLPAVYATLCEFSRQFSDTAIRIHTNTAGLDLYLAQYPGAMAFAPDLGTPGMAMERINVGEVSLVAVAAPIHPLAGIDGKLGANIMAQYFQIILGVPHYMSPNNNRGVQATRRWYADDLHVKHDLIRNGLGWGSLPDHIAADDIATGKLVKLTPDRWDGSDRMPRIPYVLVRDAAALPGPASIWLFDHLSTQGW